MDAIPSNSIWLQELQQTYVQTGNIDLLVDQFIDYSRESRGHSEWTVRTRKTHLRQFAAFCNRVGVIGLDTLNYQVIDSYFVEYTKTHSKNTTNAGRRILKVFLRWAQFYKEMHLHVAPEAIKLVRVRDRLPKALDMDIIRHVIQNTKNEQDVLMITIMTEAGLRIGELVELQVLDLYTDAVHIRGKGEIDRTVYITDSLATQLQQFIKKRKLQQGEFLFQNDVYTSYGPKLAIGTARNRIQRCFLRLAGVHMVPHQLRHTFAINLLRAGCDIVTIQNLLGHEDVTTTQVYLRVTDNHVKNEYKKYIGDSLLA